MVKQIVSGPIQAVLAILGSRLLLSTQDVSVKTFRPQSGLTSEDARAVLRIRDGNWVEKSELSGSADTKSGPESTLRSAAVSGLQLDTIEDMIGSRDGDFTSTGFVWTNLSNSRIHSTLY
jgi:hypothetical protein